MAYYDKYGVEYFDERCTQLMRCPKDFSGHYVIPKTVRWITRNAFEDCSDLESVDIPDSVEDIGERAFHNCQKLWYIIIPAHTYVREEAFHGCFNLKGVYIHGFFDIGPYLCSSCHKIYNTKNDGHNFEHDIEFVNVGADMPYFYPYSVFVKKYVEEIMSEWLERGTYERLEEWEIRTSNSNVVEKEKVLAEEAKNAYYSFHEDAFEFESRSELLDYDNDAEVFPIKMERYGFCEVTVPVEEAQAFEDEWDNMSINIHINTEDDFISFTDIEFTLPNGKVYKTNGRFY